MQKNELEKFDNLGIKDKIYSIRGCQVMIDNNLAEVYNVETKNLNLAVKRNIERFPDSFRFQLTEEEYKSLRLQIETSNEKRGGRRYLPFAFTEQGVAMLSTLLRSNITVRISIQIMRAFVQMRKFVNANKNINKTLIIAENCIIFAKSQHYSELKMLLSFKIENFRSIKNSVLLDQRVGSKLNNNDLEENYFEVNNHKILKSLIFYGRNASGKSNILIALKAFQYLVYESDKFKHGDEIITYTPYKFEKNNINKPVKFEIEFLGKESKVKYLYIIEYNSERFVKEALYFYPKGVKTKLYDRNENSINYGDSYRGNKKIIEDNLLKNQLFLSKSASNKILYLDEVYLFFVNYMDISIYNDTDEDFEAIRNYSELLIHDMRLKINLSKLLKSADTNILDFEIVENDASSFKLPDNVPESERKKLMDDYKYKVLTKHLLFENGIEVGHDNLDLDDESLGTRKLMSIGSRILYALLNGGLIVVDELDKGLHPLLTKLLIRLFNGKENNPHNAQLIFATHDSTLLDSELFRRDQICFVEKEYEGNTLLYKLSDFKGVRQNIPIDKWYLSGRFKGIPVINDVELEF